MNNNPDKFPEDVMKIEREFIDDYDKMNLFLEFFEKIKEILFNKKEVGVKEINFLHNIPETVKILPFTYSLDINQMQYLLIINDSSQLSIDQEELNDIQNLFTENKSHDGIIIVWNDDKLSSFKIYKDEIYLPIQEIRTKIKKKIQSLKDLIDEEINYRKRFLNVLDTHIERVDDKHQPDINQEFKKELLRSYNYFLSRPFRELKRNIMQKLKIESLNFISELFFKFIKTEISKERLKKKLLKLIIEEGNFD